MGSRLTFREKAGDVCYQKQLRDRYLSEGTPPVPHLDVKRARVRPVSRNLAKQIILKYEWLGTMSPSRWYYGIFFGSFCGGVCCIAGSEGTGAPTSHKPFEIEKDEIMILPRGACVHWAPVGTNTKLVSWSCRLIRRDYPAGKLMLAFADSDAGEIGTIYQGSNWIYIGQSGSDFMWISPKGKLNTSKLTYDMCAVPDIGKKRPQSEAAKMLLDAGWKKQKSNPKHRYAMVLDRKDKRLMELVESMREPYPKRTTETSDPIPIGRGGGTPTRPLQQLRMI